MTVDELIRQAVTERINNGDDHAMLHITASQKPGTPPVMVWWNSENVVFTGDAVHTVLMHIVHCDPEHMSTQCTVRTHHT